MLNLVIQQEVIFYKKSKMISVKDVIFLYFFDDESKPKFNLLSLFWKNPSSIPE